MAPRRLIRKVRARARGAWMGLCLGLAGAGAGAALGCTAPPHETTQMPETLSAPWPGPGGLLAWYDVPTTRYPHGVLGDAVEATQLHAYASDPAPLCATQSFELPPELVFEDTAPRLADLDGDGTPEIIVVQSHQRLGAQLAVYGVSPDGENLRQIAATPFIGRRNRWLAPIGAADLDGDGRMEIAYIDRPHLARVLRVWRFEGGALSEVAAIEGLTNHRIGEPFITGGLRDCGAGPELITANADWSRVIATTLEAGTLTTRSLGPFSQDAVTRAMACQD
ncbi:FG-GAP repeat domain-containing protein [Gymnodinialimonas ceratoperidinii]|uniref:VCBS repeat-containing protein n=1 Tax=Gymnodinialimonas ceratoperidinii TaxID=2856823 RepID=A0A8F6YBV2_9RHOB|nr:VCBS repeat-containing protein [Gymnodinialimonas ceratoperidinii]QXT40928.1 VCBS repeat-containing protein [Gymnodinialimonas ceratoperidinii]